MKQKSNAPTTQPRFSTFDPRYFSQIVVTSNPMTDEWRCWIAENKFAGVDDHLIVQQLITHGISPSSARLEVSSINQNPYFQSGHKFVQLLRKSESHANILTQLAALSPKSQVDLISQGQIFSKIITPKTLHLFLRILLKTGQHFHSGTLNI